MASILDLYTVIAGDGTVCLFCRTCLEQVTDSEGWVINLDTLEAVPLRALHDIATTHHYEHPDHPTLTED